MSLRSAFSAVSAVESFDASPLAKRSGMIRYTMSAVEKLLRAAEPSRRSAIV